MESRGEEILVSQRSERKIARLQTRPPHCTPGRGPMHSRAALRREAPTRRLFDGSLQSYAAPAIFRQLSAHILHISTHPRIISSSAMRSQDSAHRMHTSAQTAQV